MTEAGTKSQNAVSNQPPLPRPIQEHLGQTLRTQLYETGDKPQFLGDPGVPRSFDPLIERIEARERLRRKLHIERAAHQAVADALKDFLDVMPRQSADS